MAIAIGMGMATTARTKLPVMESFFLDSSSMPGMFHRMLFILLKILFLKFFLYP
jgi:hypothetical protein